MTAPDPSRLLKRLYRFRTAERRPGLARLFARRRKAAVLAELRRDWRGGYVLTGEGELACVPAPLDARGERLMFYGFAAPVPALAFIPPGGVAIDVGANLGEWSVPLARAVGAPGTVICVEPNPAVAAALAATLRINNLGQARVCTAALSDRDGEGRLAVDPRDTGQSRLSGQGLTVSLRRLDGVVTEAGLSRLDLVKIDVEGHELAVLSGAAESLRRFRPALILESGHETPEQSRAIAGLLDELDYDIVAVLHDYGAVPCSAAAYAAASGPGAEARNLLALPAKR